MVLEASLLNTQHYKVRIKGKWSNHRNKVAPSPKPLCRIYWTGNLQVTFDYGRQQQPNLSARLIIRYTLQRSKTLSPPPKGMSWVWQLTASDGEAPFLKIWRVWSSYSLPLLPGTLWIVVVVSLKVPWMGEIDLFKLFVLDRNTWYPITVSKIKETTNKCKYRCTMCVIP